MAKSKKQEVVEGIGKETTPPTINKIYSENLFRIINDNFVNKETNDVAQDGKYLFVIGVYLEQLENYVMDLENQLVGKNKNGKRSK